MSMLTPNQLVIDTLQREITELLSECSEPQVALFGRIFPNGIEKESEEQLKSALDLLQRTVKKNQLDPSRL